MHRTAVQRIVAGIIALGLGSLLVVVAAAVMPTGTVATDKGTFAPWLLTWGMIWTTVLTSVALAAFLFTSARRRNARP